MDVAIAANAMIILSISTLLMSNVVAANASTSSRELEALMDFRWPYINSTSHHCHWKGITCDDHGRVAELSLQSQVGCNNEPRCHNLAYLDPLVFTSLTSIHLSSCGLYGDIPPHIGYLSNLSYLNLSNNQLENCLPYSLPNLSKLLVLDISCNYVISGSIPTSIGCLSKLTHLNFTYDLLSSKLPISLENLSELHVLDISHNHFVYGAIPPNIETLSKLTYLDLSYNRLEGQIPPKLLRKFGMESFIGNPKLLATIDSQGGSKHRDKSDTIIYAVTVVFGCVFLFSIFFGVILLRKQASASTTPHLKHGDIFKIRNFDGNIAYQNIIQATQDFDFRYCIGTGAYGSVCRALLPTGRVVAVKKLHRFEEDNPTFHSSFRNEAEVLSQIRHRHIVKLLGFSSTTTWKEEASLAC